MNFWNDNYNEPCVSMTNERVGKKASATWQPMGGLENLVAMARQPMRDRKK